MHTEIPEFISYTYPELQGARWLSISEAEERVGTSGLSEPLDKGII